MAGAGIVPGQPLLILLVILGGHGDVRVGGRVHAGQQPVQHTLLVAKRVGGGLRAQSEHRKSQSALYFAEVSKI